MAETPPLVLQGKEQFSPLVLQGKEQFSALIILEVFPSWCNVRAPTRVFTQRLNAN